MSIMEIDEVSRIEITIRGDKFAISAEFYHREVEVYLSRPQVKELIDMLQKMLK